MWAVVVLISIAAAAAMVVILEMGPISEDIEQLR
jgi:hypothetical protein